MDKLISEHAAIDIVEFECGEWSGLAKTIIKAIEQLPPAQPKRKKGKWIVYYECPKCGEITKDFTEYCPFCNADMRGENNDTTD